ncbi:hypothetical protein BG015_003811 [Linnemannia schmuckeri]|uniref:Chromo domain-containing protein n=1 Tax=Linnemannia schmuckeri TaxID=64567 RepID=A0A9P5V2B2_9FUNG|nr:hypothetical protein BG015_003811 [Linnemannia schmuckeri]
MDGTYVKKEPKDDRSSTVLSHISSKDKDKDKDRIKGRAEKKKRTRRATNGNASGSDGTSDQDTPGSDTGDDSDDSEDDDSEGGSDIFEVEKVVGHRYDQHNALSYHIKWKGYPDEESTWEQESSVFCVDMVKDYWKLYNEQGGSRTDLEGSIKTPTALSLSLNGKRKSSTSSGSTKHSANGISKEGKAGGGKGSSGGRSGRFSPEPLLPDLSPLVKSSAAAAVATETTTATTATMTTTTTTTSTTKSTTSSKRARTSSPERQQSTSQASRRNSNTLAMPISTGSSKSLTTSIPTKSAKFTSESRKGTTTTTTTEQQQSRDSSLPRKLTAVGPVLITEENWTPPSHWDSWDGLVERVEAIETRSVDKHDRSTMFVHLRWKNGNRLTLHPLQEIHDKAPRRLIDFYEGHLQFQESE